MGKTPRERMLIMLLPALIVVGGYAMGYSRHAELKAAQTGLVDARAAAVDYMKVIDAQDEVAKANVRLEEVKKEKTALDARWKELGSQHDREPEARSNSVRHLSKMLWARKLHSFEESVADQGAGELPPSFQSTLTQLKGGTAPSAERRLWKVRFVGTYSDVLEALESLRDSGSPVIPVSISMSETRTDTRLRSWTLLIWI